MGSGIEHSKEAAFSEWYTDAILKAEVMDYSKVSGCMVFRPYGYAMWERVKEFLDAEIKQRGVRNAYFPLLIPESLLQKEQEHVEGFSPEVAWVTHGGNSELGERLAVRPTSETVIYDSYAKWIRSHTDLPLKLNQWCNVVRWEFKHPTPFLRTREFLWQEGHTAYSNKEDADAEVEDIIELYERTFEEVLAVPVIAGEKTEDEKFAGARYTYSLETLLPDGKAIQAATSHSLGQNFSTSFDITFQDEDEETKHVWQNSWGFTTRSLGIMLMLHGDDQGLILPPRIAPTQVVVTPILFSDDDTNEDILEACERVADQLDCRVTVDDSDKTPGWKFNHWEMKGVPLRIEIGPDDIQDDQCIAVRRDTGDKTAVDLDDIQKIPDMLDRIQEDLLEDARAKLHENTCHVDDVATAASVVQDGCIAVAPWCGDEECRDTLYDETGGKSLNKPFDEDADGDCAVCGSDAETRVAIARSY